MAALDWSQCPAVESIPGKVGGAWVFKGTRLPVATVIENLEDLADSPESVSRVAVSVFAERSDWAGTFAVVEDGRMRVRLFPGP